MSTGSSAPPGAPAGDGSGTGPAAEQAQQKAQELAGQAQEQAQQAAGQVRDRMREQLDQRSSHVAEQINSQASDLRAVSESLREQGKEGPANAASRLAEYAEKVGGYLHERDSDRLLADAEDFGRRQPWAIAAGGLALGFAASRFLKASGSRRYATRQAPSAASRATSASNVPSASAPSRDQRAAWLEPTPAPPPAPLGREPELGGVPVAPPPTGL